MSFGVGSSSLRNRATVVAVALAAAAAAPVGIAAAAPPSVTIVSGPSGPTNDSTPTFEFTPDGETVECSVDQGNPDFGPCTSETSHTATTLADGSWTFRVRVSSGQGNPGMDTREFSVDTDPPEVTIDSGPSGPTNDSTPDFGFTPEAGTTVECSVDQGTADFGACTSGTTHSAGPLAGGDWTFRVRVTDEASNATTATQDFSIDAAGPPVEVVGPKRTGQRRPAFKISSDEPGATFTCRLDSRPEVQCGPTFVPGRKLKPGRHKLVATAFDALENPGTPQTFRFRVLRPRLKERRARRTVAVALRRHDFSDRVIRELEESCSRRGRFRFFCRFSSTFPGYSLSGRGKVRRRQRLSYRFRVRAQGQSFVLKDETEGRSRAAV
jgi:Bacterial Ig-like domain